MHMTVYMGYRLIFILTITIFNSKFVFSQGNTNSKVLLNQIDSLGRRQGEWIVYSEDTISAYAKFNYLDDRIDGIYEINWIHDNSIKERGFYRNGIRDSFVCNYWQNGQIRIYSSVKNGKANGVTKSFDQKGNVTSTEYYIEGILDANNPNNMRDSNIKWGKYLPVRTDSIIEIIKYTKFKKITILENDTISKVLKVFNKNVEYEAQFYKGMMFKEFFYYKNRENIVEKIFYWKLSANWEKELPFKAEYYDKKRKLIRTELRDSDNNWSPSSP